MTPITQPFNRVRVVGLDGPMPPSPQITVLEPWKLSEDIAEIAGGAVIQLRTEAFGRVLDRAQAVLPDTGFKRRPIVFERGSYTCQTKNALWRRFFAR